MPTSSRKYVPVKKRLGELLVEAGVIDETQLRSVLAHQRKWGGRLGQCLVALRFASEAQVVGALASKLDCATVDVSALEPDPGLEAALKLVPAELARRHCLLPIAADATTLTVAMADPTNFVVADELSFRVGRRIRIAIAGEEEIGRAVRRLYHGEEDLTRDWPSPAAEVGAPPSPDPAGEADGASSRKAALLAALDRVARGQESELFEPGRLAVALARVLIRKGIVADAELLSELCDL
jgi:type IV pilus assembly protein PilB